MNMFYKAAMLFLMLGLSVFSGSRVMSQIIDLPFDPGFGDDLILVASLTGDDVVPEVTTDAVGLATMYFGSDKTMAEVNVTVTGLSGPVTGIEIREADPGTNGPVLYTLTPSGNRAHGNITDITIFAQPSLFNGATYMIIKTDAHPDG
jgi:hypothetical protein